MENFRIADGVSGKVVPLALGENCANLLQAISSQRQQSMASIVRELIKKAAASELNLIEAK